MGNRTQDLSDDLIELLELHLTLPLHLLISAFGLLTNFFNMLVFLKLGLKTSMSVGVFSLSVTDFVITCLQFNISLFYVISYVCPDSPVDFWAFGAFTFGWIRYIMHFVSCWVTTLISVERCVCVVAPFKVKQIFTRRKCFVVVLITYVIHIAFVLPIYISQPMGWRDKSSVVTNGSLVSFRRVLTADFTQESAQIEVIVDTLGAVTLPVISQVTLLVCTVWMIYSLKLSSGVRKINEPFKNTNFLAMEIAKKSNLSDREKKLVKAVLMLAILMTACNLPRFIIMVILNLVLEADAGSNRNLVSFCWELADIFHTLSCCGNFWVYMVLNSSFKTCFLGIFMPQCRGGKK